MANHTRWEGEYVWTHIALPYLALADIAADRRIGGAINLLLAKACFGDPGEIMRGLRHNLEAIVDHDWTTLTDACIEATRSPRLGTKLWALHELAILEDDRARPVF